MGLLYLGIHKDGAPGAKVYRVFGKQSFLCEVIYAVAKTFGKVILIMSGANTAIISAANAIE